MITPLEANTLSLKDVHRLLNLHRQPHNSLTSLLSLEPITAQENRDLEEICHTFENYYERGKILEGQIQFLLISPLMGLSGFHHPQIKITLEVGIAEIEIKDAETLLKGRMDILAATQRKGETNITALWVLLVESKNSSVDASEGVPQLLTYAYTGLQHQNSGWGLTTNGMDYQFIYLQGGNPPTYQLFPKLSLLYPDQGIQLLQVMKAICKLSLN